MAKSRSTKDLPVSTNQGYVEPKCVRIREAENGFTVNTSGGRMGYEGKTHVAKNPNEALRIVKENLGIGKK